MALRYLFLCIALSVVSVHGQAIYNDKERNALDQFRSLVQDVITQDYQKLDSYMIRWLRAEDLDVPAAVEFYRKNAKWRKEKNVDSILKETILELTPTPYEIYGFDYKGRPIITWSPTQVDMRQLVVNGNADNLVRYFDQILEEGERALELASNNSNGRISQGISIMDLQRFNVRQHTCLRCIRIFLDWAIHYESYHPLMAKHIVWINAPRVFVPIFELVKPLLSAGTRNALKLFPADRKEWSAYIHRIAPPEQLTVQFGGTRKN